jgi:hypothetical protein
LIAELAVGQSGHILVQRVPIVFAGRFVEELLHGLFYDISTAWIQTHSTEK